MQITPIIFNNPTGFHIRPATLFCKMAKRFKCDITLAKKGQEVNKPNGKSLLVLVNLGIRQGDEIILTCAGEDEEAANEQLSEFMKNLYEN